MKKLSIYLLLLAFSGQVFAQVIELPEIEITAVNYKYLSSVDSDDTPISVKMLQEKVAMFDLKSSEFYNDEYATYNISFYIPDGKILAAYDKNGKLIRTIEKYKDIKLPIAVREAIAERFPNWIAVGDVYRVNFHYMNEITDKFYKVRLENGNKKMKVKITEKGDFM
ncbi:nicotinate-nucleotide adenylyltransferase [Winogradskyella alexanderae]|uniref:Nicotinate-nucleotide adenylyltransferase n=1 Tax=Winogradskyella alexanderae TaxID=2877123 RepID=A0ABS7XWB1_9FLAO|nr:nicotinate-nucleotide adenylyltransferase [Winogradskyella alexanderae]MCA0133192.1 nicotinate-nucleotide adenylyltransferase [Winogradskyella alexanderae]